MKRGRGPPTGDRRAGSDRRAVIQALTDERTGEARKFSSVEGTVAGSLLSNIRHVQRHAAQLNLILRRQTDSAPRYVAEAKSPLGDESGSAGRPAQKNRVRVSEYVVPCRKDSSDRLFE